MRFIFFTLTCFIGLFTVSDVNEGLSLIFPSRDFSGESGVVPFRDTIHDKYIIKILKQYVISFYTELNGEHVGEVKICR